MPAATSSAARTREPRDCFTEARVVVRKAFTGKGKSGLRNSPSSPWVRPPAGGLFLFLVVPETGLEPALIAQPDPKSGASTNSATQALRAAARP